MAPICLFDVVGVCLCPGEGTTVTFVGQDVEGIPDQNTVSRAVRDMAREFGRDDSVQVTVQKHIPSQAGLGGGSTDAAAVILALCDAWGIDKSEPRVARVARGIGADVPFFLTGVTGLFDHRGDVLAEEYPAVPAARLVLVVPGSGVSTPAAYAEFDRLQPEVGEFEPLAACLRAGDMERALPLLSNNLEPVASNLDSNVREILQWLGGEDAVKRAMLTGSGSCVVAFMDDDVAIAHVCEAARQRGYRAYSTRLIAADEVRSGLAG